ncbi:K homology domain-like, alpha/beta [Cynara cardunculus var. scolymus]|uniref:K homology domain-like, alpha/beta n=1 Tax=Cynara cardunculus var. scolymus TaxID=59895 RepID=A0A103XTI6_CYNCS|nr:K homology domain-like, alpha/beta [Cynara cardunculus var. scolymus]
MPQSIFTTNHHRSPPTTTAICCSLSTFLPSLPSSIRFPAAKFGYALMFSPYRSTNAARNRVVICMAKERRVKMVAKQIQRELSDMLLTDQVLQYAILPEAALGADRYLSSLTTISDVEVSSDLQVTSFPTSASSHTFLSPQVAIALELKTEDVKHGHLIFDARDLGEAKPARKLAGRIFEEEKQRLTRVVKVYVSVFGDERGKEVAISGLKSKAKYVRSQLGKRMKLRLTPEVRFIEDESLERGSRVRSYRILKNLHICC